MDARPLVGPFASLEAYCRVVPTHDFEGETGRTCARPPKPGDNGSEDSPTCDDPHFAPLAGGVLVEAKVLQLVEGKGESRPACLLAWRTASGWFVDEDSDFQPSVWHDDDGNGYESRVRDLLVAAQPTATTTGRGVVGRVRQRSVRRAGLEDVDCGDSLMLYGVGPSNQLSTISYDVGYLKRCDDVADAGKKLPPSKWDNYAIDLLLPDGRLRLTQVGRHRTKGPRVVEHALPFR